MKLATRILIVLLALVMVSAVFVSCGNTTTSKKPNNPDNPDDSDDSTFPSRLKDVKFENDEGNAQTIRFVVSGGDSEGGEGTHQTRSIIIGENDDPDYNVNAKVIERNTNVESSLNVKIELTKVVGMQGMAEELETILSTALDTYDVVSGYQYFDLGLAFGENAGHFLNFNTMEAENNYIEMNNGYWDKNTFDTIAYKGAGYWITGDLSLIWTGTVSVCFVNQRIWGLYEDQIEALTGYSNIYDVVNNKKWTMDTLIELSKMCYVEKDGNDVPSKDDQLGYCGCAASINNCEVDNLSAGAHVVYSKMVDGIPQIDFKTDRNIEFGEKLLTLLTKSKAYTPEYEDGNTPRDLFAQGKVLCIAYWLNTVESEIFADMVDDYYVVPCPMLNEKQGQYYAMVGDGVSQYGIPYTNEIVPATTATLDLMAYYSKELVTPAYYDVALKDRYTRDDNSKAMIDLVHDNIYSDFAGIWSNRLDNVTWFFRNACQSRQVSSGIGAKQRIWTSALVTLLEDLETSVYVDL